MTLEKLTFKINSLLTLILAKERLNKIEIAGMQDDIDLLLGRLASLEAQINDL